MDISELLQSSQVGLGSFLIRWTWVIFMWPISIRVHISCGRFVNNGGVGFGTKKGFI